MRLDHATGVLDGSVLDGPFKGRQLSELKLERAAADAGVLSRQRSPVGRRCWKPIWTASVTPTGASGSTPDASAGRPPSNDGQADRGRGQVDPGARGQRRSRDHPRRPSPADAAAAPGSRRLRLSGGADQCGQTPTCWETDDDGEDRGRDPDRAVRPSRSSASSPRISSATIRAGRREVERMERADRWSDSGRLDRATGPGRHRTPESKASFRVITFEPRTPV